MTKILLFALPFWAASAGALSLPTEAPTEVATVSCVDVTSSQVLREALPPLKEIIFSQIESRRETWVQGNVSWVKNTGTRTEKTPNAIPIRQQNFTSLRMTTTKRDNQLTIETSTLETTTRDSLGVSRTQTQILENQFAEGPDANRILVKSLVDGKVVENRTLVQTDQALKDGRRITMHVEKTPYRVQIGSETWEVLRSESTCLIEPVR